MKIDPNLIEQAKEQLARMQREQGLSKEDRELLKRYPKHTLAAARLIDATPNTSGITGCRCAFELIRLQETLGYKITDDHT